jgi:hypothetical protein
MEHVSELPLGQRYILLPEIPEPDHTAEPQPGGHTHAYEHEHSDKELVSKRMQVATVVGNLALGAVETGVSLVSSAMSGVSDGIHNVLDGITYWKQFENLRGKLTSEQRLRNRRAGYWLLSSVSLGLSAKAGIDFVSGSEGDPHPLHVYAAAGSLALNATILVSLVRGMRHNPRSNDPEFQKDKQALYRHFIVSDMPSSAIAVFGAFMYKHGLHNIEQLAAVGSGLLSAWFFRPTKKNVAHEHNHFQVCDHAHDGEGWHHGHEHSGKKARHRYTGSRRRPDKNWWQRMTYQPRHAKAGN